MFAWAPIPEEFRGIGTHGLLEAAARAGQCRGRAGGRVRRIRRGLRPHRAGREHASGCARRRATSRPSCPAATTCRRCAAASPEPARTAPTGTALIFSDEGYRQEISPLRRHSVKQRLVACLLARRRRTPYREVRAGVRSLSAAASGSTHAGAAHAGPPMPGPPGPPPRGPPMPGPHPSSRAAHAGAGAAEAARLRRSGSARSRSCTARPARTGAAAPTSRPSARPARAAAPTPARHPPRPARPAPPARTPAVPSGITAIPTPAQSGGERSGDKRVIVIRIGLIVIRVGYG